MNEQRGYSRLHFEAAATLMAAGKELRTTLHDLSVKGALVQAPAGWQAEEGTPCALHIRLGWSKVVISMEAVVARNGGTRVGLRFVSIDVESMTHLRRLLELNFGDPKLIEREVAMLG